MIFKDVTIDESGDYQFSMSLTDDETRFLVSLGMHILMEGGMINLKIQEDEQEVPLPEAALEMIAAESHQNETAH